jgi:hypothetical protein
MAATCFVQCRVSEQTKAQLRAIAEAEQRTETSLLKDFIDQALLVRRTEEQEVATVLGDRPPRRYARRVSVRVLRHDAESLRLRAKARHVSVGTYASMALRAHLAEAAPIPQAELAALRESVAELSRVTRYLRAIQRLSAAGRGAEATIDPRVLDRTAVLCEQARQQVEELLVCNLESWVGAYRRARRP